jgi:REP element-mobilizing transposase RayT
MPVHVTLRMSARVWNLRTVRSFRVIERCVLASHGRFGASVVQYSVQGNHVHLLVEAADTDSLCRAMKGLSVRLAKGLNRLMAETRARALVGRGAARGLVGRDAARAALVRRRALRAVVSQERERCAALGLRPGQVLGDRYHARVLRTPSEVRRCVEYVRHNRRRHLERDGVRVPAGFCDPYCSHAPDVVPLLAARTWLVRTALDPPPGPLHAGARSSVGSGA